jgi:hypothetical protein
VKELLANDQEPALPTEAGRELQHRRVRGKKGKDEVARFAIGRQTSNVKHGQSASRFCCVPFGLLTFGNYGHTMAT